MSQPPLSMHVKALEEELAVRLLDRTNRGVSFTPAGEVFFEEVRSILRRLDQAKTKAQQAGQGEVGTLSIGFVSIAGYGILPPALKRFRERFPKIDVQLHELTTDAQIREMRVGSPRSGHRARASRRSGADFRDRASRKSAARSAQWAIRSCRAQGRCG